MYPMALLHDVVLHDKRQSKSWGLGLFFLLLLLTAPVNLASDFAHTIFCTDKIAIYLFQIALQVLIL